MILCEQCGNEFDYGKKVEKDNKVYIQCPYCKFLNLLPRKSKKKYKPKDNKKY